MQRIQLSGSDDGADRALEIFWEVFEGATDDGLRQLAAD